MALNLKTNVRVVIKDDEEVVLDCMVSSKKLLKKDQKKIGKLVASAQESIEDDAMKSLDDIEKAAKLRFDMQISGEGKEKLRAFAEDYGYTTILSEIDKLVSEEQGKQ